MKRSQIQGQNLGDARPYGSRKGEMGDQEGQTKETGGNPGECDIRRYPIQPECPQIGVQSNSPSTIPALQVDVVKFQKT